MSLVNGSRDRQVRQKMLHNTRLFEELGTFILHSVDRQIDHGKAHSVLAEAFFNCPGCLPFPDDHSREIPVDGDGMLLVAAQ